MSDRRQRECTTAKEIAQAKLDTLQVREGDPSKGEVLRAMLTNLQERFGGEAQQASSIVDEEPAAEKQEETRKLSPEVQEKLFAVLEIRLEANMTRHKAVNWEDVQRSLEADSEKLWSLQQMEEAGHEPDVYMEDEGSYHFGTCCEESPESARNIVYDAEAQDWLDKNRPQRTCNGNAVDIATAMGIDLMEGEQYKHLQALGRFDANTWSWLKTLDEIRKRGNALYGDRYDEYVYVDRSNAHYRAHNGAFRGSLRVSKA